MLFSIFGSRVFIQNVCILQIHSLYNKGDWQKIKLEFIDRKLIEADHFVVIIQHANLFLYIYDCLSKRVSVLLCYIHFVLHVIPATGYIPEHNAGKMKTCHYKWT